MKSLLAFSLLLLAGLASSTARAENRPVGFEENLAGTVMNNPSQFDFQHPDSYDLGLLESSLKLAAETQTDQSLEIDRLQLTEVAHEADAPDRFSRQGDVLGAHSIIIHRGASDIRSFVNASGDFYFLGRREQNEFYSMRYLMRMEDAQSHEAFVLYGFKKIARGPGFKIIDFYRDTTTLFIALYKVPTNDASAELNLIQALKNSDVIPFRPEMVGRLNISLFGVIGSAANLALSNNPLSALSYFLDFGRFYFGSYQKEPAK